MFFKESSLDIREIESDYTILESQEQYTRVPYPPLFGIEQRALWHSLQY